MPMLVKPGKGVPEGMGKIYLEVVVASGKWECGAGMGNEESN